MLSIMEYNEEPEMPHKEEPYNERENTQGENYEQ